MLIELVFVLGSWALSPEAVATIADKAPAAGTLTNTEAIGQILYTKYVYLFQAAGIVLLIAMVGAIVLTLHHKEGVKRQSIPNQVARTPATAIEVRKVKSGEGLS